MKIKKLKKQRIKKIKIKNWRYQRDLVFQFPLLVNLYFQCQKKGIKPHDLLKANSCMEQGGVWSTSKTKNMEPFTKKRLLKYILIPYNKPTKENIVKIEQFMKKEKLNYPIVLKPDTGRSGKGVVIVDNKLKLEQLLDLISIDYIVQEYCDFPYEFGVFYYKLEGKSYIFGINQKVLPKIICSV